VTETTWFIVRRVLVSSVLLLLTMTFLFVALRLIPGDPTAIRAGQPGVTQEQLDAERHALGLDRPIVEQYGRWVGNALRGDFGKSYFSLAPTTELIKGRVGATLELALVSLLLALAIAVPAAVAVAIRPYSAVDRAVSAFTSAGMAIPTFWFGIILISVFSVRLGWLPTRGYVSPTEDLARNARLILLPAVTLAVVLAAPIVRFLRASLLETTSMDYVRTAHGKGLLWRNVVIRHALPNALLPTLTFVGLIVGQLLGGVVVVEYVFGWPGLGSLAIDAVTKRDYSVLQGVVLLGAIAFILSTLIVDLVSFLLDPRLRMSAES
jgi:peptide/nickel transport system permease protein